MAGNYPDSPSWRMAYDRDGTQVYKISPASAITQLAGADITKLNNESDDSVPISSVNGIWSLVFIFPELRDIDAVFYSQYGVNYNPPSSFVVEKSVDTTNGLDGTWANVSSLVLPTQVAVKPAYRTSVQSTTALGVRAIRFKGTVNSGTTEFSPSAVHLFGEPAPGENPHRMALWHPTLDQRVSAAYFDWGNTPRSSSADRTFRVKNLSPTLTANTPRVAMEAPTDTTPSIVGQHTLSVDGTTFLAQVNPGTLAPGAISGVITLRRVTPSNAVLSLWSFRVFAEATSWS